MKKVSFWERALRVPLYRLLGKCTEFWVRTLRVPLYRVTKDALLTGSRRDPSYVCMHVRIHVCRVCK